jgi:hypothetical protein
MGQQVRFREDIFYLLLLFLKEWLNHRFGPLIHFSAVSFFKRINIFCYLQVIYPHQLSDCWHHHRPKIKSERLSNDSVFISTNILSQQPVVHWKKRRHTEPFLQRNRNPLWFGNHTIIFQCGGIGEDTAPPVSDFSIAVIGVTA